jgi:hypothetical protein
MSKQQVSRAMFEKLLLDRRSAVAALHRLDTAIARAKASGVERVTPENLTTDMTMGLGLRLAHHDREMQDALEAWHRRGDKYARDIVIDRLNDEAGLK